MRKIKKILCSVLAVVTMLSLCACGSSTSGTSKTTEDQVREAVESRGRVVHIGSKIGDNELNSSNVNITNVKKISDTEYLVSGKIVMTDVYGTAWNNTFDCEVTKEGDEWSAGSFEYTNSSWRRGE